MTGVIAVAFGLAVGVGSLLQWQGRLPRGNPTNPNERFYLFGFPFALFLLTIGLLALAQSLSVDLPSSFVGLVFLLVALLCLVGLVLVSWGPPRLRPRWQREMVADRAVEDRRRAVRGRYGLNVVDGKRARPVEEVFADLDAAEDAARGLLPDERPGAYVEIVDLRSDTAVKLVEGGQTG